jgi:electron transfer flavoprotein beta subunit
VGEMDLHIIVCLKVVPKPEEVSINPQTMTIDRARARSEINPSDMYALEMALSLKDEHGGGVSLLAMGPPFFEPYLRIAMAMGADAAFLLSDRAFAGADTLATSYVLARGIERLRPFHLVLCGEESSDGATGQVPPGIAEWLDIPQLTYVEHLEVLPHGRVRARRVMDGGYQVLTAPLPALASVKSGVNEPRFIDMDRWLWAMQEAPVTVWGLADLGLDPEMVGAKGSPTVVSRVQQVGARQRKRILITGTAEEEARTLWRFMRPLLEQRS